MNASQSGPKGRNRRGRNITASIGRAGLSLAVGGGRKKTGRGEGTARAGKGHGRRSARIRSQQSQGQWQALASTDPPLDSAQLGSVFYCPASSGRNPRSTTASHRAGTQFVAVFESWEAGRRMPPDISASLARHRELLDDLGRQVGGEGSLSNERHNCGNPPRRPCPGRAGYSGGCRRRLQCIGRTTSGDRRQ